MKRLNIILSMVLLLSLDCFAGLQKTMDVSRQRFYWLKGISVFDTTGTVDHQYDLDSSLSDISELSLATIDTTTDDPLAYESSEGSGAVEFIDLAVDSLFETLDSMVSDPLSSVHLKIIK